MDNKKVILVLPLRCILFVCNYLLLSFVTQKLLGNLSQWWSMLCSICNTITMLIIFNLCKSENITYKNLVKI